MSNSNHRPREINAVTGHRMASGGGPYSQHGSMTLEVDLKGPEGNQMGFPKAEMGEQG